MQVLSSMHTFCTKIWSKWSFFQANLRVFFLSTNESFLKKRVLPLGLKSLILIFLFWIQIVILFECFMKRSQKNMFFEKWCLPWDLSTFFCSITKNLHFYYRTFSFGAKLMSLANVQTSKGTDLISTLDKEKKSFFVTWRCHYFRSNLRMNFVELYSNKRNSLECRITDLISTCGIIFIWTVEKTLLAYLIRTHFIEK